MTSIDELARFLVQAKRSTYASQGGKIPSRRLGAKDLAYEAGRYRYVDSYFGELDFSGQEDVYLDGVPTWSMNYYGRMIRDDVPEGFIETLREALLLVDTDKPYRGCEQYKRGRYIYTCHTEGTILAFHGQETITHEGEEVYRLHFHGGQIR
jgi:hypothetical protein